MTSLVVKATRRCNARCRYCFERSDAREEMPLAVVEQLFARIDEFLAAEPAQVLEIVWHGGEPLSRGPTFFEAVRDIQARVCSTTASRIRHTAQTNATCVGERMARALLDLGVTSLGTSFDPMAGARGIGRSVDHARYLRAFLRGVAILDQHQISWGIIYVATARTLGHGAEVLTQLGNLGPTGSITINPVVGDVAPDLALDPHQYVSALCEMFPVWWRTRHRMPPVEPFAGAVAAVQRIGPPVGPGPVEDGALLIDTSGEVSPARRRGDNGSARVGTLSAAPIRVLADTVARATHAREQASWSDDRCRMCLVWSTCRGGCALDAMTPEGDVPAGSAWCHARKEFVERAVIPVVGSVHA